MMPLEEVSGCPVAHPVALPTLPLIPHLHAARSGLVLPTIPPLAGSPAPKRNRP